MDKYQYQVHISISGTNINIRYKYQIQVQTHIQISAPSSKSPLKSIPSVTWIQFVFINIKHCPASHILSHSTFTFPGKIAWPPSRGPALLPSWCTCHSVLFLSLFYWHFYYLIYWTLAGAHAHPHLQPLPQLGDQRCGRGSQRGGIVPTNGRKNLNLFIICNNS